MENLTIPYDQITKLISLYDTFSQNRSSFPSTTLTQMNKTEKQEAEKQEAEMIKEVVPDLQ